MLLSWCEGLGGRMGRVGGVSDDPSALGLVSASFSDEEELKWVCSSATSFSSSG